MQLSRKIALGAAAMTLALAAGYSVGYSDQPYMHSALDDLRAAQGQLQSASDNKGGHRERALDLVNQAIAEVHAGIDCGRGEC